MLAKISCFTVNWNKTFENWFFFSQRNFVHIYSNLVWNRLVLRWYWRLIIEKLELLYVQNRIEYSKIYGNCWFLICFWYLIPNRVWSMDENQSSSLSLLLFLSFPTILILIISNLRGRPSNAVIYICFRRIKFYLFCFLISIF